MEVFQEIEEMDNTLTDIELKIFFEQLFPNGFAGADVLADIAPEGWRNSPLLACFHPSPEQVYKESLRMHRNIQELIRIKDSDQACNDDQEPTLEEIRLQWEETPIKMTDEVTGLVGRCVWDIFSNNHEVIAADGRGVDIGSFRGAGAFIDGYITGRESENLWEGDYLNFYLGTIWMSDRADLKMVYAMIFRRLKLLGADWRYYFPQMQMVDLTPLHKQPESPENYSPSESFAAHQEEEQRQLEIEKFRAELADINRQAKQEAFDGPVPFTVEAYCQVYSRNPHGWPPI